MKDTYKKHQHKYLHKQHIVREKDFVNIYGLGFKVMAHADRR